MESLGNEVSKSRPGRIGEAIGNLFKRSRNQEIVFPAWVDDPLGYWPLHDRGGAMSEYHGPGDHGMLGVLARIEMNEDDGRPLGEGLPHDALRPKFK